jgi:hypothetical protein
MYLTLDTPVPRDGDISDTEKGPASAQRFRSDTDNDTEPTDGKPAKKKRGSIDADGHILGLKVARVGIHAATPTPIPTTAAASADTLSGIARGRRGSIAAAPAALCSAHRNS